MSFTLVSLNIERMRHLERVSAFLKEVSPDVVCLQEVCEESLALFEAIVGNNRFALLTVHPNDAGEPAPMLQGIGIFSRHRILDSVTTYYAGSEVSARTSPPHSIATDMPLLQCDLDVNGTPVRIATVHGTWTPDGMPNEAQRRDTAALLPLIESQGELVLCGDFNAPRGGEMFHEFATRWKDNIPPQYLTSIDVTLHRAGKTKPHELADKMVDGLFTTPRYSASNVRLVSGLSDHMGIVATISVAP